MKEINEVRLDSEELFLERLEEEIEYRLEFSCWVECGCNHDHT